MNAAYVTYAPLSSYCHTAVCTQRYIDGHIQIYGVYGHMGRMDPYTAYHLHILPFNAAMR